MDNISYKKIFLYLYDNYSFKPKLMHTDYENAFATAIKETKNVFCDIFHLKCLFHLIKSISDKIRKFGLSPKKINKEIYEIIKNFEIICFIDTNKIKECQKIFIGHLSKKIY